MSKRKIDPSAEEEDGIANLANHPTVLVPKSELKQMKTDNNFFRQSLAEMKQKLNDVGSVNEQILECIKNWIESQQQSTVTTQPSSRDMVAMSTPSPSRHRKRKIVRLNDDIVPSSDDSDSTATPPSSNVLKSVSFPITRATTSGMQKVQYVRQLRQLSESESTDGKSNTDEDTPDAPNKNSKNSNTTVMSDKIAHYQSAMKERTNRQSTSALSPRKLQISDCSAQDSDTSDFGKSLKKEKCEEAAAKTVKKSTTGKTNKERSRKTERTTEALSELDPHWKKVYGGVVAKWCGAASDSFKEPESTYKNLAIEMCKIRKYDTMKELWGDKPKPSKIFLNIFNKLVLRIATDMTKMIETDGIIFLHGQYKLQNDERSMEQFIAEIPQPVRMAIEITSKILFEDEPNEVMAAAYYEVIRASVSEMEEHMPNLPSD